MLIINYRTKIKMIIVLSQIKFEINDNKSKIIIDERNSAINSYFTN